MRKNKNIICYPILDAYETLAPKTLFPVNWEELLGEENVRYELEPVYDENGNYIETVKKTYITRQRVKKWVFRKRQNYKPRNRDNALFKPYSQIIAEEENRIEEEKEKEDNE